MSSLQFSTDGKLLLYASSDHRVRVITLAEDLVRPKVPLKNERMAVLSDPFRSGHRNM